MLNLHKSIKILLKKRKIPTVLPIWKKVKDFDGFSDLEKTRNEIFGFVSFIHIYTGRCRYLDGCVWM